MYTIRLHGEHQQVPMLKKDTMDTKIQIQAQQKSKINNIYQKHTALSKYIFFKVQTQKPLHAMVKNIKLKK